MKFVFIIFIVLLVSCDNIDHSNKSFISNEEVQCSIDYTTKDQEQVCLQYPAFSLQLLNIIAEQQKDSTVIIKLTKDLEPGTIKELNIMVNKYCYELANELSVTDEFKNNPQCVNTIPKVSFTLN